MNEPDMINIGETPTMTGPYKAIAEAAQAVAEALNVLDREVDAAQDTVDDPEHLARLIEKNYPFGRSLEDVAAGADEWADHLGIAAQEPSAARPEAAPGGHMLGYYPCGMRDCHMCPPGERRMNPVHKCCDRDPACDCPF